MKLIYITAAALLLSAVSLFFAYSAEYGTLNLISVVTDERDGEMDISLKNRTPGTFTVTVYFTKLLNAESDRPLPYTMMVKGNSTELCLTVKQIDKTKKWDTYFMYDYQPGVMNALHRADAVYSLPYRKGEGYRVMQGYDGKYTHKGGFRYSIDWDMPIGTEVLAARKGVVIETEDSFHGHGLKQYYYDRNNYVTVEHEDGTIARYVHFKRGGVKVRPGDRVKPGTLIGLSGDVGYSNAPHLHFSVHRPLDGRSSESIPVKFRISETENSTPEENKAYMAWE